MAADKEPDRKRHSVTQHLVQIMILSTVYIKDTAAALKKFPSLVRWRFQKTPAAISGDLALFPVSRSNERMSNSAEGRI